MKNTKRVLSVAALCLLTASIASCKGGMNNATPTGSLNLDSTYASIQDGAFKVSTSEMYNIFRNKGYSSFKKTLNEKLLQKEMAAVDLTNPEIKKEVEKNIISNIFSVTSVEDYKKIKDEDKRTKALQFVHSTVSTSGVNYLNQIDNLIPSIENDEFVCNFPESLIEEQSYSQALIQMSKDYINSIKTKETLPDDNGIEQTNKYYIGEKQLKNKYEQVKDYTTTKDLLEGKTNSKNHAIVIDFASEALAEKYISLALTSLGMSQDKDLSTLTNEEAKSFYIALYNVRYGYTKNLTLENLLENEGTTFSVDKDGNDLYDLDSTILEFMKDKMSDEADTESDKMHFTTKPLNLGSDNTRYMMYRIELFEGKDYDDLTEEELNLLTPMLSEELIEGWSGESLGSSLLQKRLESDSFELQIFDPVYEMQYKNQHTDEYEYTTTFDNNKVFKFTYKYEDDAFNYKNESITGEWTVNDSYELLNSIYGAEQAYELLSSKYLNSKEVLKRDFDDDLVKGYTDGVNDSLKTFKKGDSNYNKDMGEANYLVLTYGFDNVTSIVNYKLLASDLKSSYNAYYGDFSSTTENGPFKDTGLFANFEIFTSKAYDSYYSLGIQHLLISVDVDGDGSFEDPKDVIEELPTEALKKNFKKEIMTIANALALEAEVITAKRMDAFTTLQKTFNNEGYGYVLMQDGENNGKTWAEIKQDFAFDYAVKAEDLSTIDSSNGSNYVEAFTNEVIELYKYLTDSDHKDDLDKVEDEGYWKYSNGLSLSADPNEELTLTNYGYHLIFVNKYNDRKNAKFTRDEDSNLSGSTTVKQYENKEVIVYKRDTDTTEDDITVLVSGYSDKNTASAEQLFIYFFETTNKSSVTSMRSSTTTAVKLYFQSVMDRYNSSSFQSYKLHKQIGTITFADSNVKANSEVLEEKLVKSIDSYKEIKESNVFYGWFDLDWTIKF